MLSPEEIENREFLVSLRGYDREEVQAFLARIAVELRELLEGDAGRAAAVEAPVERRTDIAPDMSAAFAEIGRETQRILEAAQEAGDELRRRARQEADKEVQTARSESARLIADGERRLDAMEREIATLVDRRAELAESLRDVGRTLEQVLRDLSLQPEPTSSVREALEASAAEDLDRAPVEEGAATPPPEAEGAVGEGGPDEGGGRPPDEGGPPEGEGERLGELQPPAADQPPAETPAASAEPEPEPEPERHREPEPAGGAGSPVPADAVWSLRSEALAPQHPKLVRKLKRQLQDTENATLDRLRRAGAKGEAEAVGPTDDELTAIDAAAAVFLADAHAAGSVDAGRLSGRSLPAVAADDALAGRFGEEVRPAVSERVLDSLRDAFGSGDDLEGMSRRVGATFASLREAGLEEVAARHLLLAYEGGVATAARDGNLGVRWLVGVEPPCPHERCAGNAAAGVVPAGTPFPSGHHHPPVDRGCTCAILPSTEDLT